MFYSVLFWSILFWSSGLFCSVMFCPILFHSVLFCSVLVGCGLLCSVMFCYVLLCYVLFCFVLFCSILFCSALLCDVCMVCDVVLCIVVCVVWYVWCGTCRWDFFWNTCPPAKALAFFFQACLILSHNWISLIHTRFKSHVSLTLTMSNSTVSSESNVTGFVMYCKLKQDNIITITISSPLIQIDT